jgi:hypothetical protein
LKGEGRLGKREKEKRKEGRELGSRLLLLCFLRRRIRSRVIITTIFFGLLLLLIGRIDMV